MIIITIVIIIVNSILFSWKF